MLRGMLAVILFVGLTVLSWGAYGPIIHQGQILLDSSLWPFIFVGLAYFAIAVVLPLLALRAWGETGQWTLGGTLWSLAAGAAGAVGALGIILAFANRGSPVYVMPLVFGGAPVVNTFTTMLLTRAYKKVNPVFYAGLILVIVGAATVLLYKPRPVAGDEAAGASAQDLAVVAAFIALTVLCWGAYGPVLHKGQMKMAGSRLRPFICVGLAYFLIAVIVPLILIQGLEGGAAPSFGEKFAGTAWSLVGGALGALGALGIIMAFNFGGRPIFVMPLVFGGAPVVNTLVSLLGSEQAEIGPLFYAGLIAVIAGAVTVLVFAPRPHGPAEQKAPAPAAKPH
jgi:hypothetical protein